MPQQIERITKEVAVTIADSASNSSGLAIDDCAYGMLEMPAAMTGSTLTVQGKTASGSFMNVVDSSGNTQTITFVASSMARIPDAAFGAREIRFVSSGTEDAERSFVAVLKS